MRVSMIMKTKMAIILILVVVLIFVFSSVVKEENHPPSPIPEGFLVNDIPEQADLLFVSIRYVFNDVACLDDNYNVKPNFLNDPDCMSIIFNTEGNILASPRQVFALDIETGEVTQLTNIPCDFSSVKAVNTTTIMTIGACEDSDGDGIPSTNDTINIYLLCLADNTTECITCGLNLTSINNPDYSPVNQKVLFSAQHEGVFHNYLFTLDLNGTLTQLTNSSDYMDFDCSWSEDGTRIVFSRLPIQEYPWIIPSQIWVMDADGTHQEQITSGGPITE